MSTAQNIASTYTKKRWNKNERKKNWNKIKIEINRMQLQQNG